MTQADLSALFSPLYGTSTPVPLPSRWLLDSPPWVAVLTEMKSSQEGH